MIAAAVSAMGGLDVLLNNAGIAGPTAPVEHTDPDEWEKVVQINLNGTFNVTRLAIPHLKKSAAGVIINMSSFAGRLGYPDRCADATDEMGNYRLHQNACHGTGRMHIRANAILPGPVEVPRIQKVFEGRAKLSGKSIQEEIDAAKSMQSLHRLVDLRDIAALAVFLASDAAKSISGQMLPIDNDAQRTA